MLVANYHIQSVKQRDIFNVNRLEASDLGGLLSTESNQLNCRKYLHWNSGETMVHLKSKLNFDIKIKFPSRSDWW